MDDVNAAPVFEETKDGVGSWRYTVRPGGVAVGRDPASGGGQFWIITGGSAHVPGGAPLPVKSAVFVGPDDVAMQMTAGPMGADLICMQFPKRAQD